MSDVSALELKPGDLVGGYTLVSRLGSGAMGSVWRVHDDGGTVYAMKILRDSLAEDGNSSNSANNLNRDQLTARERLRREAMALKKVNHPGVCAIVDMELDDTLAFIVTELIEGKNLRDDVAINGRYVGDDLERLASKLMDAVRAVHVAGIVHRDIKPTNVMVSATGPVLVDFGIAMGEGESHVTRTGLVMGTPGFIAPEIIEGAESDETTDWWSVASVLAFAATGKPVFGTKPMMAVLEREAAGNANLSGLPANTMAAFRSALDPDRTKRCTPEQLLHTITADAMDPFAWQHMSGAPGMGVDATANLAGTIGTVGSNAINGTANGTNGTNGIAGASESNGTDVMHPFDDAGLRNPRALWRSHTQTVPFNFNAPTAPVNVHSAARPATAVIGAVSADAENGVPYAIPHVIDSTGNSLTGETTVTFPDNNPADNSTTSTATTANARPALQRIINQSTPPAPVVDHAPVASQAPVVAHTAVINPNSGCDSRFNGTSSASTQPLTPQSEVAQPSSVPPIIVPPTHTSGRTEANSSTAPAGQTAAFPAGQNTSQTATLPYPTSTTPPETIPPSAPSLALPPAEPAKLFPSPVAIKHDAYLRRSTPFVYALAMPIAAIAASMPMVAMIASTILFWLLITLGYSTDAQLRREERHGGKRRGSDAIVRVVSLPWQALKALPAAIVRGLLALAVLLLSVTLMTLILSLPTVNTQFNVLGIAVILPIIAAAPISVAGLSLAICATGAWFTAALGPSPRLLRLGAGALLGIKDLLIQPTLYPTIPTLTSNPASGQDIPASALPNGTPYAAPNEQGFNSDGSTSANVVSHANDAITFRQHSGREFVLWIALVVVTLAACTVAGMSQGVVWWPLPVAII